MKDLATQFSEIEKILDLKNKGYSDTAISKELGMSRGAVLTAVESYKSFMEQDSDVRERAKELLIQIDHHYNMLIKEAWYIIDQAKATNDLKVMNDALKTAGTFSKDRSQLYSAAGLTASDDLTDQLMQMEEEHDALKKILKEVTGKCSHCRGPVYSEIARLNGEPAEVIVLQQDA